jgi:hypothetical protein
MYNTLILYNLKLVNYHVDPYRTESVGTVLRFSYQYLRFRHPIKISSLNPAPFILLKNCNTHSFLQNSYQ